MRHPAPGFLLAAILLFASVPAVVAQREPLPPWREPLPAARSTAEITVGETLLTVDLALTGDEQQLGLGYRNGLADGTGMLFVFRDPGERVFWMKGMRFCLDIVWIAGGEIVGAAEDACPDPEGTADTDRERFPSMVPVTHVLEVPAGWLAVHGYGKGTPVEIPAELQ